VVLGEAEVEDVADGDGQRGDDEIERDGQQCDGGRRVSTGRRLLLLTCGGPDLQTIARFIVRLS